MEVGDIVTAKYPYADFYGCRCVVTDMAYDSWGEEMDILVLEGCYKGREKTVYIRQFKGVSICDYDRGYYRQMTYNDWVKRHNRNT